MASIKKVSVYCASSTLTQPIYLQETASFAVDCANRKIALKYGGGSTGMMGCLADTMLAHGGDVIGVMPEFMREVEWQHKKVSQMMFTKTMAERKLEMLRDVDGVVALPGGTGTLEELVETLTSKRLGMFSKPVIILNTAGYYDHLILFFDRMLSDNFIADVHRRMFVVVSSASEIIPALESDAAQLPATYNVREALVKK